MRASLIDRIAKAEALAAQRAHAGVILYRDRAEIPALLERAAAEGRTRAPYGVLLLPNDCESVAKWEGVARAYCQPAHTTTPESTPNEATISPAMPPRPHP